MAGAQEAITRQGAIVDCRGGLWAAPLLVDVFARQCSACTKVQPTKASFRRAVRSAVSGNFVSCHLGRITGGVPDFYSEKHMIHHSRFGTAEDAEFLNFVTPRRYWLTFLPFAVVINFSDFVFHRPPNYTRSRWISLGGGTYSTTSHTCI